MQKLENKKKRFVEKHQILLSTEGLFSIVASSFGGFIASIVMKQIEWIHFVRDEAMTMMTMVELYRTDDQINLPDGVVELVMKTNFCEASERKSFDKLPHPNSKFNEERKFYSCEIQRRCEKS